MTATEIAVVGEDDLAAARGLYASLGFRPEARAYDGLDDDLRYMVCDLTRTAAA